MSDHIRLLPHTHTPLHRAYAYTYYNVSATAHANSGTRCIISLPCSISVIITCSSFGLRLFELVVFGRLERVPHRLSREIVTLIADDREGARRRKGELRDSIFVLLVILRE